LTFVALGRVATRVHTISAVLMACVVVSIRTFKDKEPTITAKHRYPRYRIKSFAIAGNFFYFPCRINRALPVISIEAA
jgi:hypothetical protein